MVIAKNNKMYDVPDYQCAQFMPGMAKAKCYACKSDKECRFFWGVDGFDRFDVLWCEDCFLTPFNEIKE